MMDFFLISLTLLKKVLFLCQPSAQLLKSAKDHRFLPLSGKVMTTFSSTLTSDFFEDLEKK